MNNEPRLPGLPLRVIVVLLGLFALLVVYYWAHKPVDPQNPADLMRARQMGGALLDLLTVGALFTVAGGIGRALLRRVNLAAVTRPERIALESTLGLGVIGIGALFLGLIGLFHGIAFWLLLLLVALLIRRSLYDWLNAWLDMMGGLHAGNNWIRFIAIISIVLLGLALLRALTPPFAWDALTYHLVGPSRYLAAGRILPQPDNHFLGFPQLAELLFAVAISLFGRDTSAALVHFGFGLLGLLATAGLVRRYASASAAWTAIALLLSAHSLWLLFGKPYVDLAVLAYGAVAFVASIRWRESRSLAWLVLLSAYAGFALGVKYTAGILVVALVLYLLRHARHAGLRHALVFGLVVVLAFAPWLLKGLLLYGNPIYPFLFGGLSWDPLRAVTFSTAGSGLLGSPDQWQILLLPIAATLFGVETGAGYGFTAGPWLLTAGLFLLPLWPALDARARSLAVDCFWVAFPLLLGWMLLAATTGIGLQTRLLAVGLPVAAIAGALAFHALDRWPEKPVHLAFVVRALFTITLLLAVADAARVTVREQARPYLTGLIGRDAVLETNLGAYHGAMRALGSLPPGSRVRFLWEPRSYGCPAHVTCVPDILLDYWAHPLQQGTAPEAVFEGWRSAGDDYLLLWHAGYYASLDDARVSDLNRRFDSLYGNWLMPVWTDGVRYTLYTWRSSDG